MKLHELVTKVLQLAENFVYIRVNVTNSGTSLSLGCDKTNEYDLDSSSAGSILRFEEVQNWREKVDLQKVQEIICDKLQLQQATLPNPQKLVIQLEENQLTISSKTHVFVPEDVDAGFAPDSKEAKWMQDLWKHLDCFKRSIVAVAKKRYCCVCFEESLDDRVFLDPIPISRYNLAEAKVFLNVMHDYSEAIYELVDFCTTRHAVECLDRDKFEIFILYEDEDIVTYEITNKTL